MRINYLRILIGVVFVICMTLLCMGNLLGGFVGFFGAILMLIDNIREERKELARRARMRRRRVQVQVIDIRSIRR